MLEVKTVVIVDVDKKMFKLHCLFNSVSLKVSFIVRKIAQELWNFCLINADTRAAHAASSLQCFFKNIYSVRHHFCIIDSWTEV